MRQLDTCAIAEMSWMLIAPPMGRAIEVNPRARLRLRWKKFTATVRGTTPTRLGLATVLAMM